MNPQNKTISDQIFVQPHEAGVGSPLMVFSSGTPIEKLGLPKLLTNALIKNYVLTVGDFIKISRMDLVNFRNLEYKYVNFLLEYRRRISLSDKNQEFNTDVKNKDEKKTKESENNTITVEYLNNNPLEKEKILDIINHKKSKIDHPYSREQNIIVISPFESIDNLEIPKRLKNALKYHDIKTVSDFINASKDTLYKVKNLGPRYVSYLLEFRQRLIVQTDKSEKPLIIDVLKSELNEDYPKEISAPPKNEDNSNSKVISNPIILSPDELLINLELPTRVLNALSNKKIITVYDLCNASETSLFKIRNIGPKIVAMLIAFRSGIIFDKAIGVENDSANMNQHIPTQIASKKENVLSDSEMADNLFNGINDQRGIEILKQRYGLLTGERHTLDEIGSTYGVTRERIRQIQKKIVSRIKKYGSIHTKKLIADIHNMLWQHIGIIDSNEADDYVNEDLGIEKYDGSSFLDLTSDLSWVQRFQIKDLIFYTPIPVREIDFEDFSCRMLELLKKHPAGISVSEIAPLLKELDHVKDIRFNKIEFIKKYCSLDQRLEKIDEFTYRAYDWNVLPYYESLIKQVFIAEKMPLHFTEIAYKANELLKKTGRKLDERRIYSIVLGSEKFAHTGRRGTYGLTEWGIRRELLPALIEECIKKAGFPLHVDQIFYYVSKYKDTPITNVYALLYSNKKFYRTRDGAYGLKLSS